MPVWLYSYQQKKSDNSSILHYVAVNARTKETMGSVPIHIPKLFGVSVIVELLGILLMLIVDFDYKWIFLLVGFVYFFSMYFRYRNSDARHHYETETKRKKFNLRKVDNLIEHEHGLSNSRMIGANNTNINGQNIAEFVIDSIINFK